MPDAHRNVEEHLDAPAVFLLVTVASTNYLNMINGMYPTPTVLLVFVTSHAACHVMTKKFPHTGLYKLSFFSIRNFIVFLLLKPM